MSTVVRRIAAVSAAERPPMLLAGVTGFYFAFRVAIVVVAAHLFLEDAQAGVAAGLVCNYLILAVVAFSCFGDALRPWPLLVRMPGFRWVLFFVGFSACSLLWSRTASMAAAAAFWSAMAADVAIVVLMIRCYPAEPMMQALMKGYVWGTCCFAAIAWLLPAQSDLRLGDEGLLGPNQIGYACAFAFFLAQYLMRRGAQFWVLPAAFLAITLLRSLSKTSIIAFVAGQAFILLRDRSLSRAARILMIASGVLLLTAFWSLLESYYVVYINSGNQAETLTGRLGIWAYFLAESLQSPWIGHGFHSVWKVIPSFGPFEARHAHNELIQQFYAYGVVGVVMLAGLYRSVWRGIRRLAAGPQKVFFLGLLIFVLVRGLADTEAFDLSLPLWFIVLIGPVLEPAAERNLAFREAAQAPESLSQPGYLPQGYGS
jgi:exopolysaccharide production protein ExoQ